MPRDDGSDVTIPRPPERPGGAPPAPGDGGWSLPGRAVAKVLLGLMLVVGAAAGAFWYLSQPAEPSPAVDPAPAQTEIHDALDPFGYPAVLVDVTDERVLVRYEQPGDLSTDLAYALARDAAALHANGTERIVVEAYQGYEPLRRWQAPTDVVVGYLDGEATRAEVEDATTVQEMG